MSILDNRKPASSVNAEWANHPGVVKAGVMKKSFTSKITSKPKHVPTLDQIKVYYSKGSAYIIDAIENHLGMNIFKQMVIGIAETESGRFASEGYLKAAYIGLDSAGLTVPNTSQNLNVHPEILKHARLVATSQRGKKWAMGFPEVVENNFQGERHEINALASYLITQMARLHEGTRINDENKLVVLMLWAVNTWYNRNNNIRLYIKLMEERTCYDIKRAVRNYLNDEKDITPLLRSKITSNFL